ncbi:MAG TPA: sulfate ABC transporter permease subunit CysT [Jatrophihabitans sp.]|jgi:sulfate transport system permease protein
MTEAVLDKPTVRTPRPTGSPDRARLGMVSGVGLGISVLWLSLLVLIPLAAVVAKGTGSGWSGFANAFTDQRAFDAIAFTVLSSLGVAAVNAVMGTVIAWVLVRDDFPGKRILEIVIDIPFALPTIVAGLVLLTLYGPNSPIGPDWYGTKAGVEVALLFVTLPFVVRAVEPVLMALETDVEEAAASLGASPLPIFRRIVLPAITPAVLSGSALAFGRAMGEYGSVVLISGQIERKTEIASLYVYQQIQNDALSEAAATATVLLVISLLVIAFLNVVQVWAARRG